MDHGPIETSRGYRPPASGGERLLVGLATVALLGGMVLGLVNVLTPDGEEVAKASPSATVSPPRTPRPHTTPTPFPNPPPAQVVVAGEPQPEAPEAAWRYVNGWIRVKADTALRVAPADGAAVKQELHPGDLTFAWASDSEDWLTTNEGYYVRADDPAIELVTGQVGKQGGDILSVVGGPDGFVVTGARPSATWYEQARFVAWSVDGARWAAHDESSAASLGDHLIAWGPSGWVSVVQDWSTSKTWVRTSDDGRRWEWAGSLQLPQDAWPSQLVASEEGYLLVVDAWGSRNWAVPSAWYTSDGRTWEERPALPSSRDMEPRLTGVRGGFLLWEDNGGGISFSSDALSWSEASGPDATRVMVAQLGSGARAVALDSSGTSAAWIGEASGRGWRWRADPSTSAFDGAIVTNVAGSAERALAVGFDATDASPRAWINDGDGWSAAPLPPAYRGIPQQIAVGPAGSAMLVGYRPTLRGDNAILWRLGPGGWTPERQPLLPVVPDPAGSECGRPPADAVELWALERARGPACLKGVQITLRAWAAWCDGCYGEAPGRFEEDWLANPSTNTLFLSPHENDDGNWALAVLAPDLRHDPAWVRSWIEVTGHFDDPAAANCRYVPAPSDGWWQRSQESVVVQCREQFVVTSVAVVDGP